MILDNTLPNLKPGIGANVEIFIDRLTSVLAVPVDSVYTVGRDRFVFVQQGEQIVPHKVSTGANNDTHVQITDGLAAGQQVLRLAPGQGRELLEKAGIKIEPTSQPTDSRGARRSKSRPK